MLNNKPKRNLLNKYIRIKRGEASWNKDDEFIIGRLGKIVGIFDKNKFQFEVKLFDDEVACLHEDEMEIVSKIRVRQLLKLNKRKKNNE
jgi:hypothetical protein